MKSKIAVFVILFITLLKLLVFLFSHSSYFTRIFDPVYFGDLYSQSQYVIGERSKGGIGDDGLYSFAGYYYLFQKGDVSAVNFEHPPLGKYLIGLSILIFRNENAVNLIYFILLLFFTYKIGMIIMRSPLFATMGVFVLSLNNLFLDNLLRSLLDLPFTLFFTAAVYFYLKSFDKPRYLYYSMLSWAFAASTRFFPSLILLFPLLTTVIYLQKKENLKHFFLSSLIIPVFYLFIHFSFFIYHPSFMEFLRHKRWMLSWFWGTVVMRGNIWRNIYTGSYFDSTGKLVANEHWMWLIPVVVTLGIISLKRSDLTKKYSPFLTVYILTFIFLLYVTFLTGGLEKFMMPVFPLLVVLAMRSLASIYSIIFLWLTRKSSR